MQAAVFHCLFLEPMTVLSQPEEPLPLPLILFGEVAQALFDLLIRAGVIRRDGRVEHLVDGLFRVVVMRVAVEPPRRVKRTPVQLPWSTDEGVPEQPQARARSLWLPAIAFR